jgi:hypothetical protein
LLEQLFERFREEGLAMTFTMEDFNRQYIMEHFAKLTPEEQREALQALPPEKQQEVLRALLPERRLAGLSPEDRLAGLSDDQVRQLLEQLAAGRAAQPRKSRRKR